MKGEDMIEFKWNIWGTITMYQEQHSSYIQLQNLG